MAIQWDYYHHLSGHLTFTNAAPLQNFFFFNNYIILGAGQYQAWSTKILNFMWFVFLKHKLKCISSESFTKLYAGSYIYP